jgi:uncharacterized protein YjbJ (UPF0337 family)
MTDQSKDRLGGMMDEATGKGKEAWGTMTDDEDTEAEGQMDQAKGNVKQGVADAKDTVDDMVKDATD